MAATVQIRELNGAGQTATDKTSGTIRFKLADNATVDLNNPLPVPTSQTTYSYEKWLRLYVSGGTYTQISDLRMATDGSSGYGTGIKLWVLPIGAYATPVTPNVAQDPPQHGATPLVDAFSYTTGSPLDIDAINTGPFDSTGVPKVIGDYMIFVMEVEVGAAQGVKSAETLSFFWNEI